MKNKMGDVRNHLVAMLEELGDRENCTPETIERAKATSLLVGAFTGTVKVELDALMLADQIGRLPAPVGSDAVQVPQITQGGG
jgi:hypothetical protein